MLSCPAECGYTGVSLRNHYRWSPECEIQAPPPPEPTSKRKRDPAGAARLFCNRAAGAMSKAMLRLHVDQYLSLADLEQVRGLVIACVELTTTFIEEELKASDGNADPEVFCTARRAFKSLPGAGTMVEQKRRLFARAVPRTLATTNGGDKRGAVFFSAHDLVNIILQESEAVRKMAIASSDRWKTGELYKTRPSHLTDLVHGTRFLDWHAVCGKATAGEASDLRVVLHGWTDEFTPIDGLSQKARAHKYGAFTACMVNLPLRIRHYADHVLLLALYNSRLALRLPPITTPSSPLCSWQVRKGEWRSVSHAHRYRRRRHAV